MEKKSKKSIIIGITVLLLVSLILIGLTYAYYRTRIIGNDADTSISVTSKKLEVTYIDGNATLSTSGVIEPGFTATKEFSVENTGSEDIVFSIKLDNVTNTFTRTSDWVYEINGDGLSNTLTSEVPSKESYIVKNVVIPANTTYSYVLKITYKNLEDEDQSIDMGATLSLRVNIADSVSIIFEDKDSNTLLYAIGQNNVVEETKTIPGQQVSTGEEAVLAESEDENGVSYYFRGTVENNYVNFSGMCWRIVRVQGDETIKLVLADRDNECNAEGYSADNTDSAYITPSNIAFEYVYEPTGVESLYYENSLVKSLIEAWSNSGTVTEEALGMDYNAWNDESMGYENFGEYTFDEVKIQSTDNMVLTNWCDDLTQTFYEENSNYDGNGGFAASIHYAPYTRLKDTTNASPTLKCEGDGIRKVSGYYGMLTADEVAFAGFTTSSSATTNSYLKTNANAREWFTISHITGDNFQISGTDDYLSSVWGVKDNIKSVQSYVGGWYSVRPSIVLKSDVIATGSGTQTNPYVIS